MTKKTGHLAYHERATAILQSSLQPNQRLLLLAISHHLVKSDYCWPSQARLSRLSGLSRRTVQRTIGQLELIGVLNVQQPSAGKSCHYEIDWQQMEEGRHHDAGSTSVTVTQSGASPRRRGASPRRNSSVTTTPRKGKERENKEERREGGNAGELSDVIETLEPVSDSPEDSEDREERQRQKFVEQALDGIQQELHLPKSSESLSELASEFRNTIRGRCYPVYESQGFPRPCREVLLADIAAAITAEFDNSVSLGAIFFQRTLLRRLIQRIGGDDETQPSILDWRMIHFDSLANQLVRELAEQHGETDALIVAVEEYPCDRIRAKLASLTDRSVTDRDAEFCKSLASGKVRYVVEQRKELEERIASEMAEMSAAETGTDPEE